MVAAAVVIAAAAMLYTGPATGPRREAMIGPVPANGVPERVQAIFGDWVSDPATTAMVSQAITAGQIVVIRDAFNAGLAKELRAEMKAVKWIRSDGGLTKKQLQRIGAEALFADTSIPEDQICTRFQSLNDREFFFSHQRPADYGALPLAADISSQLNEPEVRDWVDRLLQAPPGTIGDVTFGVRKFKPGDVYGVHSDDTDGRRGGLSLTSYFVDPRQPWDVSKGGQFVWCADPTAPVTIPPRYNTMVLFRVDDVTDHFIEPMLAGAAARLVYQGWWRPNVERVGGTDNSGGLTRTMVEING